MSRYIQIIEVSQKQAYIFKSKKLKDNVQASEIIRYITGTDCFAKVAKGMFSREKNLVYAGGGHSILTFDSQEQARNFAISLSKYLYEKFPGIELFIKTMAYDEKLTPSENESNLLKELEKKKSIRMSAFRQGSFGIEKEDAVADVNDAEAMKEVEKSDLFAAEEQKVLEGYHSAAAFEDLGGTRNDANFIAVVHADGNSMGARVKNIDKMPQCTDFESYRKIKQQFSEAIDEDFHAAILEMERRVRDELSKEDGALAELSMKGHAFPVRRLINAGDDVCLVTEGRIGIECARILLEELNKRNNSVDGQNYTACAGVAIVHCKYPFYKAYELAEELCSNAKKKIAQVAEGIQCSAVDWHIEFGEMYGGIGEIREKEYHAKNTDGTVYSLTGRPYWICGEGTDQMLKYTDWKQMMDRLVSESEEDQMARGKYKNLRNAMAEGTLSSEAYRTLNRMNNGLKYEEDKPYLFDALEMMDTFITMD